LAPAAVGLAPKTRMPPGVLSEGSDSMSGHGLPPGWFRPGRLQPRGSHRNSARWNIQHYARHQERRTEAQVKPEPKEVRSTRSFSLSFPCLIASHMQIGMVAAVVFPVHSMVFTILAAGIPS
jgi:hypothetical protein